LLGADGPFCSELPISLNGVLDAYANLLELEFGGDEAYLFSPNDSLDRPLESSAWTATHKRAFKKHFGEEISPKTLRSSFITWLRDSTTCPEILKSAAHAQKHSERRQGSDSYDTERDTRLCKAAIEFNSNFCASFEMPAGAPRRDTRGSSSNPALAALSAMHLLKCNHDDCMALPTESLFVCGCAKVYHRSCAIKAGCAEDNLLCALCLSCRPPGQGQAGSSSAVVNLAAPRIRADAPAPPPAANSAARRCVFAACLSDTPAEGLRECECGIGPHHHFCSVHHGCEEDASRCARCLGVPVFELAAVAPPAGGDANDEADTGGGDGIPAGAVGEGALDDAAIAARLAALHCEWVDEEMQTDLHGTAETQPLAVRTLLDEMGVDSCSLFLFPEGKRWDFQRSEYSGMLHMTSQMVDDDEWQQLEGGPWIAKLMRKSRQPVPHASYRNFYVPISIDEDTPLVPGCHIHFPVVPGAPAEGITCSAPSQWGSRTKQLVFKLKLSKNGCSASEVTINQVLYKQVSCDYGTDDDMEEEVEHPSVAPLASAPASALAALGAGGAARPPTPAASTVSDSSEDSAARARHRSLEVLSAYSPSKGEWAALSAASPAAAVNDEAPAQPPEAIQEQQPANEAGDAAASLVAHEPPLEQEEQPAVEEEAAAEQETEEQPAVEEEAAAEAGQAQPPTVAMQEEGPAGAAAPAVPTLRSGRKRKAKAFFGDNGELDGPASSFRSAPAARKASVDAASEMGVPAFAQVGQTVWAMGLHAGVRKRFKAKVIKHRKLFPRIVVQYTESESGGAHPLELPDPVTAYLTMTDLEPSGLLVPA